VSEDLRQVRLDKLERIRERGIAANPERFERTHTLAEAAALPEGTAGVRVAGRLVAVRTFGKLTFAHLQDVHGRLQLALEKKSLDEDTWSLFHDLLDRGDFIGAEGALFVTKKGELTLRVERVEFLGKGLLPLPEKWHGLKDVEIQQRRRYLDLIMSPETRARFAMRTNVLREMRRFLDDEGFDEVETPVLGTVASGAAARPFVTHHNALDMDVYLRIAPETWLKRLVVGGYDKVYEVARCFRNEGMDPSHLQDFTILEYYCAYWSWEDNMRFTERLVRHVLNEVVGSETIEWRGRKIDFSGNWPRVDLAELIRDKTGIDVEACETADALRSAAAEKGIEIENAEALGRGNLIDQIYKQTCRDQLIQPCFLTGIPADALPLARRNDEQPHKADCFQLLVNGWEVIKAYSELVDPVLQRELFEEQDRLRSGGDDEAMQLDEEYLLAMEFGMPPISGWGMGIDRFCALLAGVDSLRDVTLFPLLRPPAHETQEPGEDTSADVGEFGMSREQALELLHKHLSGEYMVKHSLASAAVMEGIAEHFGKNKDTYWCMGLLHDLDFEETPQPDQHTRKTIEYLKEHGVSDPVILKAVLAHNAEGIEEAERTQWLDFALSAGETITGLVMATAMVMPDKKLASVKPASVKKRMKKKDFAKKVSRESIMQCEQIGLELPEFCEIAVKSMQGIAGDLGL
jgi:lysyl-tRNA synthetase class 2